MDRDVLRKISRSLPAEGAIVGAGKGHRGRNISAENELKVKMEAIQTSYKISSKRHNAETHELQKILYDLQRELKVSKEHCVPSPIESNQPERRFRKNSRIKKKLSVQEHDNVNSAVRSESQQESARQNNEKPGVFSVEANVLQSESSVAKRRRRHSSWNCVEAKKIKEVVTAIEGQKIDTTNSDQEDEDAEKALNEKEKLPSESLKIFNFVKSEPANTESSDPVLVITSGHERFTKSVCLSKESDTKAINGHNERTLNIASHAGSHHKTRSSIETQTVRLLTDHGLPRTRAFRKSSGCERPNMVDGDQRERCVSLAPQSIPTSSLASVQQEPPRTPRYSWAQHRKYSMPPLTRGRKPSLAQQHLMRFFPQSVVSDPQQITDVSKPSSERARRISVVNRYNDHGSRRVSSHLPPLKEEEKSQNSAPKLWTELQDCRYLRTEENEISIEDIFRKE